MVVVVVVDKGDRVEDDALPPFPDDEVFEAALETTTVPTEEAATDVEEDPR